MLQCITLINAYDMDTKTGEKKHKNVQYIQQMAPVSKILELLSNSLTLLREMVIVIGCTYLS